MPSNCRLSDLLILSITAWGICAIAAIEMLGAVMREMAQ